MLLFLCQGACTPWAGGYSATTGSNWPYFDSSPPTAGGYSPFCRLTTNSTRLLAARGHQLTSLLRPFLQLPDVRRARFSIQ